MTLGPGLRRRRGSSGIFRWIAGVAGMVVAFAAGVAVGQALDDRPPAARPVTSIATIEPWTQTARATVTRTVTQP